MQRKEVEVGKSYRYPCPNGRSIREYLVTAVREDTYDAIWDNGAPIALHFGAPINSGSSEYDPSDLPVISCDDSWLDLGLGEGAFVTGRLDDRIRHYAEDLVLTDMAWNQLTIGIMVPFNGPHTNITGPVKVRVVRTEDGLETHPGWILATGE